MTDVHWKTRAERDAQGLREHWFVAARSDQLSKRRPLARNILGTPMVLFRSGSTVAALQDRCPHKNVALSMGRISGEYLQCRYHGWAFDADGAVQEVPCHGPEEPLPTCRVTTYPVVEQDDWIWVYPGAKTPPDPPPRYPKEAGFRWFELHNIIEAPMDLVLENAVDCSHTGFAHKGLFRSAPSQFVDAIVQLTNKGVCIETLNEKSGADDVRRLAGKDAMEHTDDFIAPHTVKVDYMVRGKLHFVTILVCTPEDDNRTRAYTRMAVYYRGWSFVVAPLIEVLTRIVVRQDKAILHSQAATIASFGRRRFRQGVADTPAIWLQKALRKSMRPATEGDTQTPGRIEERFRYKL